MYFARAITRAQRRYAPGVLSLDILSTEEAIDLPAAAPTGGIPMPQRKSDKAPAEMSQAEMDAAVAAQDAAGK